MTNLTGDECTGSTLLSRVREVLLDPRLRAIWILLGFGMVMFTGFRFALFLARREYMHDLGAGRTILCFLMGMRFDLKVLGYVLMPLVLAMSLAPDRWFQTQWFRRSVTLYSVTVVSLGILGETIGTAFFLYENFRVGRRLHYLTNAGTMLGFISHEYPVWLLVPGLLAIIYASYRFMYRRFWQGPLATRWSWRRPVQAIVVGGLCVLAARGSLGSRPLQKDTAYVFQNRLVVQLTMNNFFTLVDGLKDELRELYFDSDPDQELPYPPMPDARRIVAAMLDTPASVPLPDRPGGLWRHVDTGRPRQDYNVVMIVMEGMSCDPVGALGSGAPSFTPNFDRLTTEGLFFDRMYAVGTRTNNGLVGVLCGHPDLLKPMSLMKDSRAQGRFLTLPMIFKQRGYQTMFLYGGTGEFDDMNVFFSRAGGIDRFINKDAMTAYAGPKLEEFNSFDDGMPDDIVLRKAIEEFDAVEDRPFFGAIMTLSNHKPYGVPAYTGHTMQGSSEDIHRLNAYQYADWALGEFFKAARTKRWFKRTLFVLVADHAHQVRPDKIIDVPSYRVPCVFYAPGIVEPCQSSTICSQTDVAPTLLAILGGQYDHPFMGRDVKDIPLGKGFAVLQGEGIPAFVEGDHALVLPPSPRSTEFPLPWFYRLNKFSMDPLESSPERLTQAGVLQRKMLAYYAVARDVFLKQTYGLPRPIPTTAGSQSHPADHRPLPSKGTP